jgi:hypothetical protein
MLGVKTIMRTTVTEAEAVAEVTISPEFSSTPPTVPLNVIDSPEVLE